MARESRDTFSAAKIKTFASQLREFADSLDAVSTAIPLMGLKEIETTHSTAIGLGMRLVDGFCGAARDSLRNDGKPNDKSGKKPAKKRVRSADTDARK